MTRKILILILALVLVFAIVIAGCQQKDEEEEETKTEVKEPIKIGAIVSETGPYAALGTPEKKVLQMEVDRINKEGGVDGRDIEVIIEDDGTDEAKTVAAATKLIEKDKVIALIGATGTGQTMAIVDKVAKAEIPLVSMAGGNAITNPTKKWVFSTPPSNYIVVPYALDYLKSQGFKRIGLITDSGGFGKDGKEVIETEVGNYGLEIVADETYNPTDVDMKAQLTKIKGTDAEVILAWTAGKGASIIAKNTKELEIDIPLVISHGIGMEAFIGGAADAANGVIFPIGGRLLIPDSFPEDNEQKEVTQQFVNDYKEKYDESQSTFGGHAYDALNIIINSLKRIDSDNPSELRDEIEKTTNFAGTAGLFSYTEDDHMGLSEDDLNLIEIQDGKWVSAESK